MSHHIEPLAEPVDATLKRLEQRIAGRKMARELFSLIEGDTAERNYMESLIEELEALSGIQEVRLPIEQPRIPIASLGATTMPFGQHLGKQLDDVPLEYLDWLCRSQEEFYRDLRAYLKHPDLEARRSGEIGEPA